MTAPPFSLVKDHQDLLEDRVRTEAFRRAIKRNVRPGDVVLDLGAGTGVLSFFAARAGARRVYAVERADILSTAREASRRMGLADRIIFLRRDALRLRLPEKVDVILHEQVGLYLFEEGMLEKAIRARQWLKPGGRVLPRRLDVFMAPSDHRTRLEEDVAFWERRPYGLDLAPFAARRLRESLGDAVRPWDVRLTDRRSLLAAPRKAFTLDFTRDASLPGGVQARFRLRPGSVPTGFVLFFTLHLDGQLRFSTAPGSPLTHWGQVFVPRLGRTPVGRSGRAVVRWRPRPDASRWEADWAL